jgi:hypothetical protein
MSSKLSERKFERRIVYDFQTIERLKMKREGGFGIPIAIIAWLHFAVGNVADNNPGTRDFSLSA